METNKQTQPGVLNYLALFSCFFHALYGKPFLQVTCFCMTTAPKLFVNKWSIMVKIINKQNCLFQMIFI